MNIKYYFKMQERDAEIGMSYVSLSRVKNIDDLAIHNFNPNRFEMSVKQQSKMNSLKKIMDKIESLSKVTMTKLTKKRKKDDLDFVKNSQ